MDCTKTHTRYQRSNSEQLEVNAKLFIVLRKRNISIKEKVKKIKKLLGKKPQPDINAQDGNDNWNSALHMAIERNGLEVVNFLLSQEADATIENGDGKTPLQLAEECNHVEIIDSLKKFTSEAEWLHSDTDRLALHTSQPAAANPNEVLVFHKKSHAATTGKQAASTVLPPFSGELRVDKELKLSHDNFKQSIKQFYGNKQLSAIDQLKATPPYPTPHVLAQFASMAYRDCKHGDSKLPEGWKLLTTASNFGIKNGYFGTAYWHPEHRQVVIAHRGTETNNVVAFFKDLYTDIEGVLRNKYVDQMSSASTFANKVVTVLQEIEQEKKISFELFFTGHSLGGWLAQITTFTTKYLEENRGTFLNKLKTEEEEPPASSTVPYIHKVRQSYHPHTIIFDSPGCKDMLLQMADKLDVRHNGRSIDLQHLDIISYLSAPNLINTSNSHLGTVYRIFIDLSDMGSFEQNTPLYNLATHSMDKIVQAFDSEAGQVCKDNKGRLRILEVVDWPVSAGLTWGEELKDFFKRAEHLNDYHPDVMDTVPSKVTKGYHPLRYQTKAYDECKKNLSVFTQDEQEFLECYRWLCQVKEFFKPEDLFCIINNADAEKQAVQMLQDFEVSNEVVSCPDANTLNALIPYVKQLIRLFPQIKEKVKDQLSSPQIRNRVYQYETQRYAKKIGQTRLDFKPSALGLIQFLTSDQQIWQLQMVNGDAWTGITKVYRVLQKTSRTPNYSSEGHYTILKLKRLQTINLMINLNALLASMEEPHLLMIACENNQPVDKLENMFQEMFSILKQKNTMKIILTTQSDDNTAAFIQQIATETLGEGFITTDEQLTWGDLSASSQTKMLEKTVLFQGKRVALNQITCAESMPDSFPLADLLQEKVITIGEEPVLSACSGYNEKYDINRTFQHNVIIRQDILIDKEEEKLYDLLTSTEQEFKKICQRNPTSNVHWLVKNKSGDLVWQQSQGNLKSLHKYIDAQKSHSYAPSDLDNLLQQARNQRVMIIADTAGMGKTTALNHVSKRIKQKYPAHWLVRINLNDYTEVLKAQKGKKVDKERVLEFVSKEVLKLETHLEKELFKKSFEGNEISKVVVMVDGFDEISPNYKETVLDMLQVLKQTSLEQLWVTTRPHLREELEDNLQQLSYNLQPLSEVEQVEFLKKFWLQTLKLEATDQDRLQIYGKALIRKLEQSISDKDKEFTGIPLQTHMLAEAFAEDFLSFYLSEKSHPEFQHKLDLLGLYRRFIDRKYDIYFREKCKIPVGNVAVEGLRQNLFKQLQEKHELLALVALFTEDQVTFLQNDHLSTLLDEELARIGIVQRNNEGKPQFIHRTFAEYFVAEFLIKQLTKQTKQCIQVQDFLLNIILLRTDCQVIRALLDGLLEMSKPSEQALKDYGEKFDQQWNDREVHRNVTGVTTALHQAAAGDNVHIVGFLLDSLKSGEYSNTIKMMSLAIDDCGRTALHMAAVTNSVQALERIWEWVDEVTPNLTYILLLSQNKESKTAWQLAAEGGHIEVVEKLWNWAIEAQINPGGLQNKLLLAQNSEGRTAWHVAAERGSVELTDKLWGWAKKELSSPDFLKTKFLLSRDKKGINAWHIAAKTGNVVILGKLWDWAKELQLEPEELRSEVWVLKDRSGQTAWHMAAEGGHVEVLERLWEWAKEEKLNPDCLKGALFLSEDSRGFSTWCCALRKGHVQVLQKLWGWAEELQLTTDELRNKLFLAVDKNGNTAIYWTAHTGSVELLEKLWGVCKENPLKPNELSKILFATWHEAATGGHLEILWRLWLWAGEVQLNTHELQRGLLFGQNKEGETVWHMAAAGGHVEVLEKLWGWAKENLNTDYLKNVLFLPEDSCGFSTWCYAIREARVDVIQKLWVWAEELQLTTDELKNKLFLAVDRDGNSAIYWAACTGSIQLLETMWGLSKETQLNADDLNKLLVAAWHEAAAHGSLVILERLWLWAGEVQINPHELQRRLLLETNKNASSACYMAVAGGHIEVLEKLWGWAKEVQIKGEQLKDKYFLDKHPDGRISLHLEVKGDYIEKSDILLGLSEESQVKANDLRSAMLLARDKCGNTIWQLAVRHGKIMVLQKLLDWAEEIHLNQAEVWNKLLLDKEEDGQTAWILAAKNGNEKLLEEIWVLTKEQGTQEKTKSKLLLAQNEYGQTALHLAAESSVAVLEKLWAFAKETKLKKDEVKNKLLLSKDKYGYTAWHRAAERGSLEALESLWNWAKEAELNPDEMLLVQNEEGKTACHLAAERDDDGILQKMWNLVSEAQVNSKEIKNKLLLVKDKSRNTAWHLAAKRGSIQALETLWSCAKDVHLKPHELLLGREKHEKDSLQLASQMCKLGVLEERWVGAKEVQMYKKDLRKTLLLTKNNDGRTAWHEAAVRGNLKFLETLRSLAKEADINTDELLLLQTRDGCTALKLAAGNNHVETIKKLWVWAEEMQRNPNELKIQLFLSTDKHGNITWHRVAANGSLQVLETLWNWAKEMELNTNELLLAKNWDRYTAFHLAAENNHVETLKKLWLWAEETQINPNELKNKLFLAKDKYGYIAWHRTAAKGSLQALETLWIWAKEAELNTDELLLAQSEEGVTSFQLVAEYNHLETLKKMWVWAEETQINPNELKKKLFLSKDKYGYIAWHRAALGGSLQTLETLWAWAKEAELNTDELLLTQSKEGVTSFHLAAENNHIETLKKLWVWAEEMQLSPNQLKKNLFLAKDKYGYIAWHQAAAKGSLQALETLWSWAKGAELNPDELLLVQTGAGYTAFQLATENNHVDTLKKLWVWAEGTQINPSELKNKLFLAKDKDGYTAWHRAALRGRLEVLEILWGWAGEAELNPDELLLAQSEEGVTSFQLAAGYNHLETLKVMWVWAEKMKVNPNELKNKLFLAQDKYGYIAWHRAALEGRLEALETLWNWAKETERNTAELLLAQSKEGVTCFHLAAGNNNVETLKKLWVWAEEMKINPKELKRKLFLAKDKYGHMAWHQAAESGSLQALEILWIWAKEVELNADELLLAQTEEGFTAFQLAAENNHVQILKQMWIWAKEKQLNPNDLTL